MCRLRLAVATVHGNPACTIRDDPLLVAGSEVDASRDLLKTREHRSHRSAADHHTKDLYDARDCDGDIRSRAAECGSAADSYRECIANRLNLGPHRFKYTVGKTIVASIRETRVCDYGVHRTGRAYENMMRRSAHTSHYNRLR